jgi:hypothetical protein
VSSEERDIILQMVAENKISTGEAADLLDALTESEAEESSSSGRPDWLGSADDFKAEMHDRVHQHHRDHEARRADAERRRQEHEQERRWRRHDRDARRVPASGRSLLIHVSDGEETRTHVHIPLGMALAAGKFIPKKARAYFEEYGIDLTDLIDSISNDLARVGEIINIRDGETRVQVVVTGGESSHNPPPVSPTPPNPPMSPSAPSEPAPTTDA